MKSIERKLDAPEAALNEPSPESHTSSAIQKIREYFSALLNKSHSEEADPTKAFHLNTASSFASLFRSNPRLTRALAPLALLALLAGCSNDFIGRDFYEDQENCLDEEFRAQLPELTGKSVALTYHRISSSDDSINPDDISLRSLTKGLNEGFQDSGTRFHIEKVIDLSDDSLVHTFKEDGTEYSDAELLQIEETFRAHFRSTDVPDTLDIYLIPSNPAPLESGRLAAGEFFYEFNTEGAVALYYHTSADSSYSSTVSWKTISHEVLHALGLKHTFAEGGDGIESTPYDPGPNVCSEVVSMDSCEIMCSDGSTPDGNVMSYYTACATYIPLPEQIDVAECMLQNHHPNYLRDISDLENAEARQTTVGCEGDDAAQEDRNFETIQTAIDDALEQDQPAEITVCQGTYKENVMIDPWNQDLVNPISIEIKAKLDENGTAHDVVLDGFEEDSPVLAMGTDRDDKLTITDIDITGGFWACVYGFDTSIELNNVSMTNCGEEAVYFDRVGAAFNNTDIKDNPWFWETGMTIEDSDLVWNGGSIQNNQTYVDADEFVGVISISKWYDTAKSTVTLKDIKWENNPSPAISIDDVGTSYEEGPTSTFCSTETNTCE